MRILALDQASLVSGYSVFDNKELITSGTFTATGKTVGHKLTYIRNKVNELIEQYNIDEVALEDIQLQKGKNNNVHTYKVLAEVIGVIEELLVEKKIKYEIVSSATWRSQLGITGKVREVYKKEAQQYALTHYNKKVSEDESDAICIGAYKINHIESGFDWS